MKETDELNEYLNAHARLRDHLVQYEIPKEEAKKVISWYLISLDIDEMIDCLNSAEVLAKIQPSNLLLISALWEKMIIGYGRIFGQSKDGYSTLPVNLIGETDKPLHNEILKIRHSCLAHRGENELEHHKLILSIEGTEEYCHIQFIVPWVKVKGQYGNPVAVRRYLKRLKKAVLRQLAYKREKFELQIFEELGLIPNLT